MLPLPHRPVITLTTDFGLSDHYVGTMKGVILTRCPQAEIVDISHQVPSFSVLAGAYTISQAAPFFPAGTIHVIVIDPGVGTLRKTILAEAGSQFFIAPDNGVLSLLMAEHPNAAIREITNRDLWLPSHSETFHGRDVFAPAAALLASGAVRPEDVGPELATPQSLPNLVPQRFKADLWQGIVLSIDHFGNVITNFRSSLFPISEQAFTLDLNSNKVMHFFKTFGVAPSGILFAYLGSSGYLEIGMNQSSAAQALAALPGQQITLSFQAD